MVHDKLASVVALARTMLMECGGDSVDVKVNRASLQLVLETFIGHAQHAAPQTPGASRPLTPQAVEDAARRTVAGRIAQVKAETDAAR